MFRLILIFVLVVGLSACANSSTIITGKATDPIDINEVEVFYTTPPDCEFDVIALIKIPGEYYNRAALIEAFKQKAAAIGAPAVQIIYLQQTGTTEYFGSARAIRCR